MSKQQSRGVLTTTSWQGPIPAPEALDAFRKLVPDAPDRILTMAEEEARSRREQTERDHETANRTREAEVVSYHESVKRSQWMAFFVVISTLAVAAYCASIGQKEIGVAVATAGIANIFAQIFGRNKQ